VASSPAAQPGDGTGGVGGHGASWFGCPLYESSPPALAPCGQGQSPVVKSARDTRLQHSHDGPGAEQGTARLRARVEWRTLVIPATPSARRAARHRNQQLTPATLRGPCAGLSRPAHPAVAHSSSPRAGQHDDPALLSHQQIREPGRTRAPGRWSGPPDGSCRARCSRCAGASRVRLSCVGSSGVT
jgi:hypothetical protein